MNSIQSWIIGLLAAAAGALILKSLPGWLASEEDKMIAKLLEKGDAADDELVLAMVKWADAKIPGGQQGHLKYKAVADLVAARFPLLSSDKLDEIIEAAVDRMKEQAEQRLKEPPKQ